jgi:aminoglycoside N3'-acetyltransferase
MTIVKHHYTRQDLIDAIGRAGIVAGDTVSLQVSLGRLGLPEGASGYDKISNLVIDAFLDVLGSGGTLIVPTYSYSIGRGILFEVETTPSSIGDFTEIFRRRPGVIRSRDPMLSSAGIGPRAEQVLRGLSTSCYGTGSAFDRLKEVGAKVCTLGISLYWATFRHHIEEMAEVPFRFRKMFNGLIRENGVTRRECWVYFAAPFIENCEPVGLPLEKLARAAGLVRVEPVGRGELMCVGAREYFDFGLAELRKNPWLTAKGPACDVAELVRLEDERVGVRKYSIDLPSEATMPQMVEALWNFPRDLVSEGYDAALYALAEQAPMNIAEYPTGTECWTWIVPEKWTCHEAYLETMDGRRLFSYADNLLHVPSYSWPFNGVVSRQELLDHISVHPVLKDAVPYHYLFYKREWGLCCSETQRDTLTDDQYRVVIDAAFSYGTLKAGESVIRGSSDDCVVICSSTTRRRPTTACPVASSASRSCASSPSAVSCAIPIAC